MLHLRDIAAFYIAFNFINNFLFFWNIDMTCGETQKGNSGKRAEERTQ